MSSERRIDAEQVEMVRVTVRVPVPLQQEMYRFAADSHIKPSHYASLAVAIGHGMLKRMLAPEQFANPALAQQASEPTAEEVQQLDAVLQGAKAVS